MADDTLDIYSDLPNFNYEDKLIKLESEKDLLNKQVKDLQEELMKEKSEKEKLKKENETLERNITSLYKTAKSELRRKQQLIEDLRIEKDDILFRRKKRGEKEPCRKPFTSKSQFLPRRIIPGNTESESSDVELVSENIANSPQSNITHENNTDGDKQSERYSTEKSLICETDAVEIISCGDRKLERNKTNPPFDSARRNESTTEELDTQNKQNEQSTDISSREKHSKQSSSYSSEDRRAERSRYHSDRGPHGSWSGPRKDSERGENSKYTTSEKHYPYRNHSKDDYRTSKSFGENNETNMREHDYCDTGYRSSRQNDMKRGETNGKYSNRRNKFESEKYDSSKNLRHNLISDNNRQRRKQSTNSTCSSYSKSHTEDETRDKFCRSSTYRNESYSRVHSRSPNREKSHRQKSSNYTTESSTVSLSNSGTQNSLLSELNLPGNRKDGVISRPYTPHSDKSSQCNEKDEENILLHPHITEEKGGKNSTKTLADKISKISGSSTGRDKQDTISNLHESIKDNVKEKTVSQEHVMQESDISGNLRSCVDENSKADVSSGTVLETVRDENKRRECDQPIKPSLELDTNTTKEDNSLKNTKDSDSTKSNVSSAMLTNTSSETETANNTVLPTFDKKSNKVDKLSDKSSTSNDNVTSLKNKKTSVRRDSVHIEDRSVAVDSGKEEKMSKKNTSDIASTSSSKFIEVISTDDNQEDNSSEDTATGKLKEVIESSISVDKVKKHTTKLNKEEHKPVKQISSDFSDRASTSRKKGKKAECETVKSNEIATDRQKDASSVKGRVKHKESRAVTSCSKTLKNINIADISEESSKYIKHSTENIQESKELPKHKETDSVQLQRKRKQAPSDETITAVTSEKENDQLAKRAKIVRSKKSPRIDTAVESISNQKNAPGSEDNLTNSKVSKQVGNVKDSQNMETMATVDEKTVSEKGNCVESTIENRLKIDKRQLHTSTSTPVMKTKSNVENDIRECFEFSLPISPIKSKYENGMNIANQLNTSYSETELIKILETSGSDNSDEVNTCSNISKEKLQYLNKKENGLLKSDVKPSKHCTESSKKVRCSGNNENSKLQTTVSCSNPITHTVTNVVSYSQNHLQNPQIREKIKTHSTEDLSRKDTPQNQLSQSIQSNVSSVTVKGNVLAQRIDILSTNIITNDKNKSSTPIETAITKTRNMPISSSNEQCEFTRNRKRKMSITIISSDCKVSPNSNVLQRQKEDGRTQKTKIPKTDVCDMSKEHLSNNLGSHNTVFKNLPPQLNKKDTSFDMYAEASSKCGNSHENSKDKTTKAANNSNENRYSTECANYSDTQVKTSVSKSQNEPFLSNIDDNLNTSVSSNSSNSNCNSVDSLHCNAMPSNAITEKHADFKINSEDISAASQTKSVVAKFKIRSSKKVVRLGDSDSVLSIKSNVSSGSLSNSETDEKLKTSFTKDINEVDVTKQDPSVQKSSRSKHK